MYNSFRNYLYLLFKLQQLPCAETFTSMWNYASPGPKLRALLQFLSKKVQIEHIFGNVLHKQLSFPY